MTETQGCKADAGKVRWSLLPRGTVSQVVEVLEDGVTKYAENNWMHVPDARRRYYDALQRHLEAWWSGESRDPESGRRHMAHAACCVLFLLWFDSNGGGE